MKTKYIINDNDKFGSWTVIKGNLPKSKSLVRCVCGFEKLIRNSDLFTGRSKSCGKKVCGTDYRNLSNLKFGHLSVTRPSDKRDSNGSVMWECVCVCGKICLVSSKHLISGNTKSCGCKKIDLRLEQLHLLSDREACINRLFDVYRRRAKTKYIDFNLDKFQFAKLIVKNCYYCGVMPSKKVTIKKYHDTISFLYNGVDRINSNKGYSVDNCVTACWTCNRAKGDLSVNDFLKWIIRIFRHQMTNILIYLKMQVYK